MCKKKKKAWKVKVKGKKSSWVGILGYMYMYIVVYADYIHSLVYIYKNARPCLWPCGVFSVIFSESFA